jgi:acetoin utilization protein AcuB
VVGSLFERGAGSAIEPTQELRGALGAEWGSMGSMLTPTVRSVMTPAPEVVVAQADTSSALERMQTLGVRHLPVMDRDRLVGVVSERDLRSVRAFLDYAPGELGPTVGELCSRDLLVVGPDDPLDEAATAMADRRVGAALVVEGTDLVGIMTCVDLCKGLTELVSRLRAVAPSNR